MYADRTAIITPAMSVLCVCAGDLRRSRAFVRGRWLVESILLWHRPNGATFTYDTLPPVEYGPAVIDGELVVDAATGGGWSGVVTHVSHFQNPCANRT